jgi:hypothetical protein
MFNVQGPMFPVFVEKNEIYFLITRCIYQDMKLNLDNGVGKDSAKFAS